MEGIVTPNPPTSPPPVATPLLAVLRQSVQRVEGVHLRQTPKKRLSGAKLLARINVFDLTNSKSELHISATTTITSTLMLN